MNFTTATIPASDGRAVSKIVWNRPDEFDSHYGDDVKSIVSTRSAQSINFTDCRRCPVHCGDVEPYLYRNKKTQTPRDIYIKEDSSLAGPTRKSSSSLMKVTCDCGGEECCHPRTSSAFRHRRSSSVKSTDSTGGQRQEFDSRVHGWREWGRGSITSASGSDARRRMIEDAVSSEETDEARREMVKAMQEEKRQKEEILDIPRRSSVTIPERENPKERYRKMTGQKYPYV